MIICHNEVYNWIKIKNQLNIYIIIMFTATEISQLLILPLDTILFLTSI